MQNLTKRITYDTFASVKQKTRQMKRYLIIAVFAFLASMGGASAQKIAVKTNALYMATATPNLGFEFALGERWTFELEGGYNPWMLDADNNIKVKHWLVSPEFRYWFCNSFQGHFFGINANYTQFNISALPFEFPSVFFDIMSDGQHKSSDLRESRIQGWAAGTGLTYGYAFPISRLWNMEFTLGLGCWYTTYDEFESRKCGLFHQTVSRHVVGPTALGLSFIYMIK